MYAQLGDIKFELITYWKGLSNSIKTQYVEHAVIEEKPKLQWIGDRLEEINIRLNFHTDFCIPKEELSKLKKAMLRHEALDFVFGNGEYKGKFVIEEISSEVIQAFHDSEVISAEAEIKLKEWVEDKVISYRKEKQKAESKIQAIPKKKETAQVRQIRNKDDVEFKEIVRQ